MRSVSMEDAIVHLVNARSAFVLPITSLPHIHKLTVFSPSSSHVDFEFDSGHNFWMLQSISCLKVANRIINTRINQYIENEYSLMQSSITLDKYSGNIPCDSTEVCKSCESGMICKYGLLPVIKRGFWSIEHGKENFVVNMCSIRSYSVITNKCPYGYCDGPENRYHSFSD